MRFVVQLTEEELFNKVEEAISKKITPLEKAIEYLTDKRDNDLLKLDEVAAKLHVTDRTVRNWVKSKKLKCYWLGARQYFRMKDIIDCMQTNF